MKTKAKKKTYTVRIEWPVYYYCDTVVKATSPEAAARIAMEDPDYDSQDSHDEPGDSTVEGVCEGDEYDFMQHIDVGDDEVGDAARGRGPELLAQLTAMVDLIERDYAGFDAMEEWQAAKQLITQITTGKEG